MARRKLSIRQKNRIQSIQERRRERAISKKSVGDEELENLNDLGPEVQGTVITNFGAQVDVEGTEGSYKGTIYRCHLRTNLDPLVTGDRVSGASQNPMG